MALLESETFTFTWRIENFSMCPQPCNESIGSPTFVVGFLEKTEWQLEVYPKGYRKTNYVSCYLKRTKDCSYSQDITIRSELSALSAKFGKHVRFEFTVDTFQKGTSLGHDDFCSREKIFDNENGLLPNDILTVQCVMGSSAEKLKSTVNFLMIPELRKSNYLSKKAQCSSRTRIKVTTKSVLWPIERFHDLTPNQKLSKTIESAMEDVPTFDLTFSLNQETETDPCACIEIYKKSLFDEKSAYVRCHIRTVGVPKTFQYEAEDKHYFKNAGFDDIWRFPTFINTKELMQREYFSYTDDILYLHFDFSFSFKGNELNIEDIDETCSVYCGGTENPNARKCKKAKLFRSGKFSDITLRVNDWDFKVHKNILSIESDVFCAMFESDMREHRDGIVDITDLEPDVVERFLGFLYTDTLEPLIPDEAIRLYTAADKYNVLSLKHRCRNILISALSVSSVCEILTFADERSDEDLLEAVMSFIRKNANLIFHSEDWRYLTKHQSQIAATTMLYFLTNNF